MEKKETKNNQQFFANIVDTYDMIEVTSGRGCSECPNYILGRDLGYCKNHSTSGNSYLLPKESRMKITYSPVYESIWTDVVWAVLKLAFFALIVAALIKYLL